MKNWPYVPIAGFCLITSEETTRPRLQYDYNETNKTIAVIRFPPDGKIPYKYTYTQEYTNTPDSPLYDEYTLGKECQLCIEWPPRREIPYAFTPELDSILSHAFFQASLHGWGMEHEQTSPNSVRYVVDAQGIESPIGYILIYGSEQKTTIDIQCKSIELFSPDAPLPLGPEPTRLAIELILESLEIFVDEAIHAVEESALPVSRAAISADDVIRRFYRRRRYNPDLQLKDICQEFGISYAYVRKRKVAFDRRRKPRGKGNT